MTQLGPYEVHPMADVFPLVSGEAFDELVRDVKESGLQQAIVLTADESTIVDGRNRYRACMEAGVDPFFETLPERYDDALILDYIVTANIRRRHLNPSQLAVVALDIEKVQARLIAERERDRKMGIEGEATLPGPAKSHDSASHAASVVGASRTSVVQAKAVARDTPDLIDKVRSGELALDAADKQRKARVKGQPKPDKVEKAPVAMLHLVTDEGVLVEYPEPKAKAKFNETRGDGISWAAWSWNPVTGCRHGCAYCYARELATGSSYRAAYPVGFTPLFHHERLAAPANTTIPKAHAGDHAWRRVFVCSMADLYGKWVPDEWIEQVHAAMLAAPEWEYLLLTKFPSRYLKVDLPPRAWVGTSVDTQRRVTIAENAFRKIEGVAVKWLSLEPLLEPLVFRDLSMFDWIVIGAQTETHQPGGLVPAFAPPFEWVARIVAQARDAGCKVHLKPNLRIGPGMDLPDEYPEGT